MTREYQLHDVSLSIGLDTLTWPGDPPVGVERTKHLAVHGSNVSDLRIGTHTGTHVDPPLHFVEGADGVDRVPLDLLVGPCVVSDARGMRGRLGPSELDRLDVPAGTERLLLRSDNSDLWRRLPAEFPAEYVCLSPDGAAWVVERGIRLLGVDFLSVEQKGAPGHPTHVELLSNGVVVVEGLNLGEVEPGPYTLVVLPLKIVDGDGGPARAILIAS
jgi:arylformamidase